MIWSKKIIDLFKSYGFVFKSFPPTEDELKLLSSSDLKGYRDLKNIIQTAYQNNLKNNNIQFEEKIEYIKKLLIRKKLTVEEIAEDFDTTIDFVLQIKKDYDL